MSRALYALGGFCIRRRYPVIVAWLALVVITVVVVIAAEATAVNAGFQVATGAYVGQQVSSPAVEKSEAVGLAAAVVILLYTFGTAVAMILPIVTSLLGLAVGLSLIGLLGHAVSVPTVGPTLGTMLGLGLRID